MKSIVYENREINRMNKACITWRTLPVSNITQCDFCKQSGDPLKPCIDSCQTTNFPLCSTWMNKKLRGLFLGSAKVAQHHNTQCFECDLQVLQLFKAHKYWSKQKQPTSFLFTCSFNVTWIRKQSLGEQCCMTLNSVTERLELATGEVL